MTFAALFVSEKREKKEKLLYVKDNTSSTAIAVPLLPLEKALYPLFLLHMQAQKKKLSKRKRRWGLTHMRSMCVGVAETGRFRALRSATTAVGGRHRLLKKAGENFN